MYRDSCVQCSSNVCHYRLRMNVEIQYMHECLRIIHFTRIESLIFLFVEFTYAAHADLLSDIFVILSYV